MNIGDRVSIIPHRSKNDDGSVRHVLATVVTPHRETGATLINGDPVVFYVDVKIDNVPGVHGYHEASLELVDN